MKDYDKLITKLERDFKRYENAHELNQQEASNVNDDLRAMRIGIQEDIQEYFEDFLKELPLDVMVQSSLSDRHVTIDDEYQLAFTAIRLSIGVKPKGDERYQHGDTYDVVIEPIEDTVKMRGYSQGWMNPSEPEDHFELQVLKGYIMLLENYEAVKKAVLEIVIPMSDAYFELDKKVSEIHNRDREININGGQLKDKIEELKLEKFLLNHDAFALRATEVCDEDDYYSYSHHRDNFYAEYSIEKICDNIVKVEYIEPDHWGQKFPRKHFKLTHLRRALADGTMRELGDDYEV